MSPSLLEYYGRRAAEYERIYQKPERQPDLEALTALLQQLLEGEDVLELACGTGYWTAALASVVRSIVGTDASPEALALAQRKTYPAGRVRIELCNAYAPGSVPGRFTAGFSGFWWSHVPWELLPRFLGSLHRCLGPGARVVFCDNRYFEGSNTAISREDAAGNTYQRRRLANGEEYEVLKNFPAASELDRVLRSCGGTEISIDELAYYWCAAYRIVQ